MEIRNTYSSNAAKMTNKTNSTNRNLSYIRLMEGMKPVVLRYGEFENRDLSEIKANLAFLACQIYDRGKRFDEFSAD